MCLIAVDVDGQFYKTIDCIENHCVSMHETNCSKIQTKIEESGKRIGELFIVVGTFGEGLMFSQENKGRNTKNT